MFAALAALTAIVLNPFISAVPLLPISYRACCKPFTNPFSPITSATRSKAGTTFSFRNVTTFKKIGKNACPNFCCISSKVAPSIFCCAARPSEVLAKSPCASAV